MITVDSLVKTYSGHVALNGISCSIPEGSICAIVGPNGAGKSTLLKILTQILVYDSGTIDYGAKMNMDSFRQHVAYLPEQRGLYPNVDVETQLVFFATIRGMGRKEASEQVDYWLKRFDIESWKLRRVSELSKGMQQKVQFISCLVSHPTLMFMDEPFSGVDPVNFRLFIEVLQAYQKATGATVVLSTHNMNSVEELCKDVVLLNKGQVEIAGEVNAVKQSYTKGSVLSMDVFIGNEEAAIDDIKVKLSTKFQILSTCVEQGHLFLDISNPGQPLYAESMRQALHLLEGYEVYQCIRRIMSMEDIFIELSKI